MKLVLQIAGGILLAGLIAFSVQTAVVAYVAYEATNAIEKAAIAQKEAALARQERQLEQDRKLALAQAQEAQRQQAKQEEMRRHQKAQRESADRKQAAWYAYYQPPDHCNVYRSSKHMVECVNDRMRASREFSEQYQDDMQPMESSPIRLGDPL